MGGVCCLVLLVVGCAQGGSRDAGTGVRLDAAGRDAAAPRRDAANCDDEGSAGSCTDATSLGALSEGDMVESPFGLIQTMFGADWYVVEFPLEPGTAPDAGEPWPDAAGEDLDGGAPVPPMYLRGSGEPTVELVLNEDDAFRFEIRTDCSTIDACGGGGTELPAMALTSYSFRDEPDTSGNTGFATRDVAWPERLYIRVHPVKDPGCHAYQLRVSR